MTSEMTSGRVWGEGGGFTFDIFYFEIIHCHYCCSLSSVLFSRIIVYNLFIALCKIDDESPHESTWNAGHGSTGNRVCFEIPRHRDLASILADFAFRTVWWFFFIYTICHTCISTKGVNSRVSSAEICCKTQNSTVILHVRADSAIFCIVQS